jgi:hypothetical protein
MKLLNTKIHGMFDYAMGFMLIALPYVFGFADHSMAQHLPIFLGLWRIIMSVLTNYELGLVKAISMRVHLTVDYVFGLILLFSPVLFGFYDKVYLPHVIFGLAEITLAIITDKAPLYASGRKSKEKQFSKQGKV